jgi:cytochrome c oxidase subunit II
MAVALVLVAIALGSVLFHVYSPWWWTPIASNWGYIDTTLIITFWITGTVFVAVVLFTAYCVFRFRHRPGSPSSRRWGWSPCWRPASSSGTSS